MFAFWGRVDYLCMQSFDGKIYHSYFFIIINIFPPEHFQDFIYFVSLRCPSARPALGTLPFQVAAYQGTDRVCRGLRRGRIRTRGIAAFIIYTYVFILYSTYVHKHAVYMHFIHTQKYSFYLYTLLIQWCFIKFFQKLRSSCIYSIVHKHKVYNIPIFNYWFSVLFISMTNLTSGHGPELSVPVFSKNLYVYECLLSE